MQCEKIQLHHVKRFHINPSFFQNVSHRPTPPSGDVRAITMRLLRVPVYELGSPVFQHETRIQHMAGGAFFILSRSILLAIASVSSTVLLSTVHAAESAAYIS
jgi:hypothetical protein